MSRAEARTPMMAQSPSVRLELLAATHRSRPALITAEGGELSWSDLVCQSRAYARQLSVVAHPRSMTLGILTHTWASFAVSYFGALTAGMRPLPLPSYLQQVEINRIRSALSGNVAVQGVDIDGPTGEGGPTSSRPDGEESARQDTDAAEFAVTSGTTGQPKLLATPQSALRAKTGSSINGTRLIAGDVILQTAPAGSSYAVAALNGILHEEGISLVCADGDVEGILELSERHAPTFAFLSPAVGAALVTRTDTPRLLASLRGAVFAAAGTPGDLVNQWTEVLPSCRMANSYSSTEAWPSGCSGRLTPGIEPDVGLPWDGREIRLEQGGTQIEGEGEEGEILLRSRGLSPRWDYDKYGEFPPDDDWVRTGDIGVFTARGTLKVLGRVDDAITQGGFKIYPAMLEEIVRGSGLVLDVVVQGHKSHGAEYAAAVVVLRDGADESGILGHCRRSIGSERAIRQVCAVESVPRRPGGKPDRRRIAAIFDARSS